MCAMQEWRKKMALPYEVNFSVLDGAGDTASGKFYIKSTQSVANALVEAEGLLDDIAALSIGQISSARMLVPVDITGLTSNGAPDAFSNRRYKFRVVMNSAEGHETILNIPAADIAESVGGTDDLDTGVGTPGETLVNSLITSIIVNSMAKNDSKIFLSNQRRRQTQRRYLYPPK